MKPSGEKLNRRIHQAGVLLVVGLVMVFITLFWSHALSFILFCAAGLLVCSLGMLLYLYALVE